MPTILSLVAKVMISLPDDLLAGTDAQAKERHSTTSATLRELAEVALGERRRRLGLPLASCDERDLVSAGLAELPSTLVARGA